MNEWNVLESLHTLLHITDDTRGEMLRLCRAAADELLPQLKDPADADDPRIIRAAAGVAYYYAMLRKNAEDADMSYFKAGDVVVHRSDKAAQSRALQVRESLLLPALPLLRDDRFLFRSV
ncbi:MAG: hypothetical protein IJT44_02670 [Clostridia bacterium]|nr:hypothetical protein [Clostridia bacterium]